MNIEALSTYPVFSDNLRAVTALKVKQSDDIADQIKRFKKAGGKIKKVASTVMDTKNRNAKENGAINYKNDVLNGKAMDKPLKPKP